MKNTQTCPKCQSRKLWLIEEVRNAESGNAIVAMSVTSVAGTWTPIKAGTFEAWVCVQCGYTEWYAKNANEKLWELSNNPQAGVHFIDTSGSQGGFR